MRALYVGISSKFIHTMPAGWFLCEYALSEGYKIDELYLNINAPYQELLDSIVSKEPTHLFFSMYIFNISIVTQLIDDLYKVNPSYIITIGGPEVDETMIANHIIIGEGERAIVSVLKGNNDKIIVEDVIESLDVITSPYTEARLLASKNKLVYYESSRGCPYRCTYCMAGLSKQVRYFSIDRVFTDIARIVESGVPIIKFTDRTFNANKERTRAIFEHILQKYFNKNVCFHFEVNVELFDDTCLDLLAKMPIGRVQLEIGVQTLNKDTQQAICRPFDYNKFKKNTQLIRSYNNIHIHLDLIAGLPQEDYNSFKQSFDGVISLNPHQLQLGFLKFLKGTPIRDYNGAKYSSYPPYTVISTPSLNFCELIKLRGIENIVDKLYNSGKFIFTLKYIFKNYNSYFDMFYDIYSFFATKELTEKQSEDTLYRVLLDFMDNSPVAKDILKFDYLITNNSRIVPKALKTNFSSNYYEIYRKKCQSKSELLMEFDYLPNGEKSYRILSFDYSVKDAITGQYQYSLLDATSDNK